MYSKALDLSIAIFDWKSLDSVLRSIYKAVLHNQTIKKKKKTQNFRYNELKLRKNWIEPINNPKKFNHIHNIHEIPYSHSIEFRDRSRFERRTEKAIDRESETEIC